MHFSILMETSDCPPYANPQWNNPGNALDQGLSLTIPKNPKYAKVPIPVGEEHSYFMDVRYLKDDPSPILGLIGVLKNGVVLYGMGSPCGVGKDSAPCPSTNPDAPTSFIDAYESEGWTFDQCGGHPSPMGGQYHIHSAASFINSTGRVMCDLPTDTDNQHSVSLGWMLDGFEIYGHYSQGGKIPTQLDSCHGHTHEINGVMTYHYHMPTGFPYITGCFKGCPEASNNQNEFGKFNGDATYGCPNGLADDPDPLIETLTPTTSTTQSTSTSTSIGATAEPSYSMSPSTSPTAAADSVVYSLSVLVCSLLVNIII